MLRVKDIAAACSVVATVLVGATAAVGASASAIDLDVSSAGAVAAASSAPAAQPTPTAAVRPNPDGTITVSGHAKPGSTVSTTFPDGSTGSAVVNPDGSYSITSAVSSSRKPSGAVQSAGAGADAAQSSPVQPQGADGASAVNTTGASAQPAVAAAAPPTGATAADAGNVPPPPPVGNLAAADAGKASVASNSNSSGVSASGSAPLLSPTATVKPNSDGSITVSGRARPGSTVSTTFPDGSTGSAVVNPDGSYSITSAVSSSRKPSGAVQSAGAGADAAQSSPVQPQGADGASTVNTTGPSARSATAAASPTGATAADAGNAPPPPPVGNLAAADAGKASVASNSNSSGVSASGSASSSAPLLSPTATVKPNSDGSITVSGRARPGSTVSTTFPDGSTGSAVAGPDGSYLITSAVSSSRKPSGAVQSAGAGADAAQSAPVQPQGANGASAANTVNTTGASARSATAAASPKGATAADAGNVPPPPPIGNLAAADAGKASVANNSGVSASGSASSTNTSGNASSSAPLLSPTAAVKPNPDGSITVSGRAKPGSMVSTTFPDGSTGSAVAGPDGSYLITSASGARAQTAVAANAAQPPAVAQSPQSQGQSADGAQGTGNASDATAVADGSAATVAAASASSGAADAGNAPDNATPPSAKDTKPSGKSQDADSADNVVDTAALAADMSQNAGKDNVRRLDSSMPEGPLTLDQAVLLAVSRHPSITSQIATIAQANGSIDVARAGYYPQVTMGTGSGTTYIPGEGNKTGNTVTMQISQMIYDFGKVSDSVDQAKATVKREEANLLQQIAKVEQLSAEALINAHRYQTLVAIAREQVDAVQKVYQMAQLRAKSGVSSRADPIQAETRVQAAQATLIGVQSLDDQTRQHLRTLVGGAVPGDIALPLDEDRVASIKIDGVTDPDTSQMPGVLVAQASELIARSQLDSAKAQMLPTLSVNYTEVKNITGVNTTTYVDRGSSHALTMGFQWTAFQGGALAAQVHSAQHALDAARLSVAAARLDGSDAARGYRDQALGAYNRLDKLAERKASIEQTRDLYREQYKLGSRSILDLLNAEQEYYQAELDEEAAKHDYWVALVDYIGALGTGNMFYGIASQSIQGVKVQ